MTPIILLNELKAFIGEKTKDLLLPVRVKGRDPKTEKERPAQVFLMRVPDKDAETQQIPYILIQILKGADDQKPGRFVDADCQVRLVFAVYSEDCQEGSMHLLNLISRVRLALLESGMIGNQFVMGPPLEYFIYPDSTAPYYLGEMAVVFSMPPIESEVDKWL